jgi:hypothetical protein
MFLTMTKMSAKRLSKPSIYRLFQMKQREDISTVSERDNENDGLETWIYRAQSSEIYKRRLSAHGVRWQF